MRLYIFNYKNIATLFAPCFVAICTKDCGWQIRRYLLNSSINTLNFRQSWVEFKHLWAVKQSPVLYAEGSLTALLSVRVYLLVHCLSWTRFLSMAKEDLSQWEKTLCYFYRPWNDIPLDKPFFLIGLLGDYWMHVSIYYNGIHWYGTQNNMMSFLYLYP